MGGQTKSTTDHDTIRRWVEARDGKPATVRGTQADSEPGVLTFDFVGVGAGEEDLEHLDWGTWFEKFEDKDLELLYQEDTADGDTSRFFKLVERSGS